MLDRRSRDPALLAGAFALFALPAAWGGLWAPFETARAASSPLATASIGLLGSVPAGARLPGVLAAAVTVWLTYRLGTAWLGRRRGFVAAAVLATCPLVILQGSRLLGDAPRMLVEALAVSGIVLMSPRYGAAAVFCVPLIGLTWGGAPLEGDLGDAVRHVGLGLFPWISLVPGALGGLIFGDRQDDGGSVVAAWACGGLLATAVAPALGQAPLLTAAPAIALVLAGWRGPASRLEGALAATVGLLVATDALTTPSGVVASLLPAAVVPASMTQWIYASTALLWAAWGLTEGAIVRSLVPALGLALTVAPLQTGALSTHLSREGVIDRFEALAAPGEQLLAYKLGDLADPNHPHALVSVRRRAELRRRMTAGGGRVFALIKRDDLLPLDQMFRRQRGRSLPVLDDTSAEVLLVSNQILQDEEDRSPLAGRILATPPEGLQTTTEAVLDGVVALLGADLSAQEVSRGGSFDLTLHFGVRGETARRWRIFVHMEQGEHRVPTERTDHDPLRGGYPTERWRAGEYIADTHTIDLPWLSVPPGVYLLYAGLYQGEDRAPVTPAVAGDGLDRVLVGQIRVKSL